MILTNHAVRRVSERGITFDDIAAALAGKSYRQINGYTVHVDRSTRTAVVYDPTRRVIVTAFRLRRSRIKRSYSR